jgi:hypothetical protein
MKALQAIAMLAAAAGLGIATPATGSASSADKMVVRATAQRQRQAVNPWGGLAFTRGSQRRARPGWSNKHVQRMATKRRNQARHRRAGRG